MYFYFDCFYFRVSQAFPLCHLTRSVTNYPQGESGMAVERERDGLFPGEVQMWQINSTIGNSVLSA